MGEAKMVTLNEL